MANSLNTKPCRTDLVAAEWEQAGILEFAGPNMQFTYKHETCLDLFGDAISTPLEKRYTFTEADRGPNDFQRKPWKGDNRKRNF
jgi:hypothetical protein